MAYTPATLTLATWASPLTIQSTDLLTGLDDAVNAIVDTNAGSIKNHINTELAKVPTYLSAELVKVNAETTTQATTATNAAISATASALSATNSASATNADVITTNADVVTTNANVVTATTQAGISTAQAVIATTQAGIATTKAGEASTSASNALASQNASALSASNALASEQAASALLDSFDDRYLGAKASAPTLDNDGNALVSGALYYNTTSNAMFVRDTTLGQWISLAFNPTDHGSLTGLADDDHTQYHNDTRGDARYYTKAQAQEALVSGTNIKTIGGVSVLGSGDLAVTSRIGYVTGTTSVTISGLSFTNGDVLNFSVSGTSSSGNYPTMSFGGATSYVSRVKNFSDTTFSTSQSGSTTDMYLSTTGTQFQASGTIHVANNFVRVSYIGSVLNDVYHMLGNGKATCTTMTSVTVTYTTGTFLALTLSKGA